MEESVVSGALGLRPEFSALLVLVLGVIAARLLSGATGFALGALDERMARLTTSDAGLLSPRLIALTRTFVFWLVIILTIALALRVLGVGGAAVRFDAVIIEFIPRVLVAVIIVVAGHLLGLLASTLLLKVSDDIAADSIGPQLLHGVVLAIAVVMALQHLGVDITFITSLLLTLVAIAGGGLMLAVALGARRHVANLMARRELGRLAVGEHIRIDDVEGQVVEIFNTGVDIATKSGITTVPAARFAETSVVRIRKENQGG